MDINKLISNFTCNLALCYRMTLMFITMDRSQMQMLDFSIKVSAEDAKILSNFRIQNSFFPFSILVISQPWIKGQVLHLLHMAKGI